MFILYKHFRTKFIITPGYFSWNISRPSSTVPFIQDIILGFEISSGTIWRRLSAASSYRRRIWSFRAAESSVKEVLRRRIDSIRVHSSDWLFMKISDHFFQIVNFLYLYWIQRQRGQLLLTLVGWSLRRPLIFNMSNSDHFIIFLSRMTLHTLDKHILKST